MALTGVAGASVARAELYCAPYRPGATYVSTGRGCAPLIENLPDRNCQLLGPYIAAL